MDEETVTPQEDNVVTAPVETAEPAIAEEAVESAEETSEATNVPLSALQKERRKRQDLEAENRWLREQQQQKTASIPEPDDSRYESATKEDLSRSEEEIIRKVEERTWIKNNPERYERVNELLPGFLKLRPNLAEAIKSAPNRYEEAWELMDKLTPKEQKTIKTAAPKKETPGSPANISKAASLNQAVDVMSMSDAEFHKWRQSQKRRRAG